MTPQMPPEEDKNTPVIQSIDEPQKTEHPPRQGNDTQDGKEGRRPEDAMTWYIRLTA